MKMNRYDRGAVKRMILAVGVVAAAPVIAVSIIVNGGDIGSFIVSAATAAEENVFTDSAKPVVNGSSVLYEAKTTAAQTEVTTSTTAPKEAEIGDTTQKENNDDEDVTDLTDENDIADVLSMNISEASENIDVFSEISGEIYTTCIGHNGGENFIDLEGGGQIWNLTEITNDVVLYGASRPPSFTLSNTSLPQVLIYHTHTSESYESGNTVYFDSSYTSRSADPDNGVVAVGSRIAKEIAAYGISVIHDGTVHDDPLYEGAYIRSEKTVKQILEQYPSVKVILDIHRDGVTENDGTRVALVKEINGKEAAQIMIVSAADNGNYAIPGFMENLSFASALQQQLEQNYEGITRPVLFQYCQYNQHLSSGALLIEVGTQGNSVSQANYSGELLGKTLGKMLSEMITG